MTCGVHRFCAAEAPERCPWCEVSKLEAEVERLRAADAVYAMAQEEIARMSATITRLRAERNHLVDTTDLGALSERLEEDNAATDAKLVRSAMHSVDRLRTAMTGLIVASERGSATDAIQDMLDIAREALEPSSD